MSSATGSTSQDGDGAPENNCVSATAFQQLHVDYKGSIGKEWYLHVLIDNIVPGGTGCEVYQLEAAADGVEHHITTPEDVHSNGFARGFYQSHGKDGSQSPVGEVRTQKNCL